MVSMLNGWVDWIYILYKGNYGYLHFQSKPVINLEIFKSVQNLMNDTTIIDSYHVKYASNSYVTDVKPSLKRKWIWSK